VRDERESVESIVVGVLLDIVGTGVVVLALGAEVPDRRKRAVPRIARAVEPGERDERAVDREPCDRVVRAEVAPAGRAPARAHDCADDASLQHLAFQPLGDMSRPWVATDDSSGSSVARVSTIRKSCSSPSIYRSVSGDPHVPVGLTITRRSRLRPPLLRSPSTALTVSVHRLHDLRPPPSRSPSTAFTISVHRLSRSPSTAFTISVHRPYGPAVETIFTTSPSLSS